MTIFAALPLLLAQAASPSPAAAPPSPPPSPGARCQSAPYRQFDFWIGEWEVTNQKPPAGPTPPPGKSRISRILNGCAILEEYETPAGYAGKSLNFHDGKAWHQVWIDNGGAPLFLEGGMQGPSMVLADKGGANGAVNRITWTPLGGGRVRQHWEISRDGGKTFESGFDGLYTPVGGKRPQP
jgi:hypothetical protein